MDTFILNTLILGASAMSTDKCSLENLIVNDEHVSYLLLDADGYQLLDSEDYELQSK